MSMTQEQKVFYVGKKRIEYLMKKEREGRITEQERKEKDEILQILFEAVYRFGVGLAKKRLCKFRKDSDAYPDIMQGIAEIFYERLPYYDPTQTTPTTYFLRYFNQVITDYILKYSQHLSQYDSHNVSIVRAAIKDFEERGIKWDEPMIVTKTGLSPKVVKYTLHLASNSIWANVDDNINVASHQPTPEESYIDNEKTETIYRVLKDSLTEEELEFFLYKVNLNGKERTYNQVAEGLGMPVRDVKKKWSRIIARLNANRELQSYDNTRRGGSKITITLHKSSTQDIDEDLYFSGLKSAKLHSEDE